MFFTKRTAQRFSLTIIAIAGFMILVSWSFAMVPTTATNIFYASDTIPGKCAQQFYDLDKALEQLEEVKELTNRDIAKKVAEALNHINAEEMQENIAHALKSANNALKDTDMAKIKQQVAMSIAKIDMKKINEQVQLATAILQPQIEQSLKEAQAQIEKAQDEIERAKQKLIEKE